MAWQSIREVQNQFKIESGRSGREVGDFKLRCQKGFGQNLTLKRERGGEEEQGRDIKVEVQIELWLELDYSELVPFLFCESHSQAGSASQNLVRFSNWLESQ